MKIIKAYLNLYDNSTQDYDIKTEIKDIKGVKAVYFKGFSKMPLDMDFGAGIDFKIEGFESFVSDFRHCEIWCMPAFGKDTKDIPDETQGLICKKADGSFAVVIPVVSKKYKCVLCGKEDGIITAKLFSWYDKLSYCDELAFVYAEGDDPFKLLESTVKTALEELNTGVRIRAERRYPEIFEYLGWCSWDAMEIRVNEDDLLKKCEEFKEKNIPVKWAVIDDMWGEVHDFYGMKYENRREMFNIMHYSKLYSFKADPIRFPNGLKNCIKGMNDYGITVGMWHPTTGYWMGIDPEGEVYKDLKDSIIYTQKGAYIHDYKQENSYRFYNAYHDYLRKCGVEFVKIDNQSISKRFYKNLAPVGEVAKNYHDGMEASVGQHFDNAMINCMGMASEDMWSRSVSPLSRCSDDFQPEDSAWFIKHIMQCSYNDLIQGQFYFCDWDMWWTDDGQAVKNSILRAVSGGPIYVSDKIGRSNRDILMPLITNDGKILRCDRPAFPTADCLTEDHTENDKIFKLQNVCDESGIIAVFNINKDENPVNGTVSPSEVYGLEGEEFAVYEHFSKELLILKKNEKFNVKLDTINDYKLYIIVPLKDGFAPIGRTDKFISPKTVRGVFGGKVELTEPGEYAYVENKKLVINKS